MSTELIEFENEKKDTLRGIKYAPSQKTEHIVIFLHGFERNTSVERKFKSLSDQLLQKGVATLRFDATGCGLSDGEFRNFTIANRASDFEKALATFAGYAKVSIAAHSLGACVLDHYLSLNPRAQFSRILLIAPALNQKELLRYWFTQSEAQKNNPAQSPNWQNYREYMNEDLFQAYCQKNDKMTSMNFLGSHYFTENENKIYGANLQAPDGGVLHVHGNADNKVPLESMGITFDNQLIVKGGDHDLERPDMLEQWLLPAVEFLNS